MKVNYTTQRANGGDAIIINKGDGIEVNFGVLIEFVLDSGKVVLMEKFYAENFFAPVLGECQSRPFSGELHHPLTISIENGNGEVYAWAQRQEDVAELAAWLSAELQRRVRVLAHSCYLAQFVNGQEQGERRTLENFYDSVPEEDLEETRF